MSNGTKQTFEQAIAATAPEIEFANDVETRIEDTPANQTIIAKLMADFSVSQRKVVDAICDRFDEEDSAPSLFAERDANLAAEEQASFGETGDSEKSNT